MLVGNKTGDRRKIIAAGDCSVSTEDVLGVTRINKMKLDHYECKIIWSGQGRIEETRQIRPSKV